MGVRLVANKHFIHIDAVEVIISLSWRYGRVA